jgi:hypothetical protein
MRHATGDDLRALTDVAKERDEPRHVRAADTLNDLRGGDEAGEEYAPEFDDAHAAISAIRKGRKPPVSNALDTYNRALEDAAQALRDAQAKARNDYETAVKAATEVYHESLLHPEPEPEPEQPPAPPEPPEAELPPQPSTQPRDPFADL